MVDPPRAGLDAATEQLVSKFNHILYISCNPHTLRHNLESFRSNGHHFEIRRFALFDQFPYTGHTECGMLLARNH